MITEQDLQEAIAECQGVRNPNASTCLKLASLLTIQRELFGKKEKDASQVYSPKYLYDIPSGREKLIEYSAETEFAETINGMDQEEVLAIMDELMTTLNVIQPKIYASVIRKLKEI